MARRCRFEQGPRSVPTTRPPKIHAVDARHPAVQLVEDGPLADRGRGRAPDESVGAEDEEDHERERRDAVSASDRWVNVSMIRPAHQVAEREPPRQRVVADRSQDPADRGRGGHDPVADLAHPELVADVEHEHGPGGAVGHVEGHDRDHERAHRGMFRQPSEALADVPEHALRLGRRVLELSAVLGCQGLARAAELTVLRETADQHRAQREADRVRRERDRRAGHEQERADRRGDELVDAEKGRTSGRWRS